MTDLPAAPVRFGTVGTGTAAGQLAADLQLVDHAELAAVASRHPARGRRFADAWAVAGSTDFDGLLADPSIDVIHLATPNHLHAAQALACIAAGKHVLVEKPLATTADDARKIADAATAAGVFCMEGLWTLFLPAVTDALARVADDRIGLVRHLHCEFAQPVRRERGAARFDPAQGGGVLLDRAIYGVALSIRLLGRPEAVSGVIHRGSSGVDELASILLGYPDGAAATIVASFGHEGRNVARLAGTAGTIEVGRPFVRATTVTETRAAVPSEPATTPTPDWRVRLGQRPVVAAARSRVADLRWRRRAQGTHRPIQGVGMHHQIDEVVRCLAAGTLESPIWSLADSVTAIEILDHLAAVGGGRTVPFEPESP